MPTRLPEGLHLSAYLPREDIRDAVIGRTAPKLIDLPHGATVGSSSLRRQALIRRMRPDINVITFRGSGRHAAAQAAGRPGRRDAAGLCRPEAPRQGRCHHRHTRRRYLPAGTGAGRDLHRKPHRRRPHRRSACADQRHQDLRLSVSCERAFLAALDGSCRTPIGGYAVCEGDQIRFSGLIITPDGRNQHAVTIDGNRRDAVALGTRAGQEIRARAGSAFFEDWS
jgi:hydroxymethylbilane synthase